MLLKACKNTVELEGMRACHLRDAAVMVEFLAWLDEYYKSIPKVHDSGGVASAGAGA